MRRRRQFGIAQPLQRGCTNRMSRHGAIGIHCSANRGLLQTLFTDAQRIRKVVATAVAQAQLSRRRAGSCPATVRNVPQQDQAGQNYSAIGAAAHRKIRKGQSSGVYRNLRYVLTLVNLRRSKSGFFFLFLQLNEYSPLNSLRAGPRQIKLLRLASVRAKVQALATPILKKIQDCCSPNPSRGLAGHFAAARTLCRLRSCSFAQVNHS